MRRALKWVGILLLIGIIFIIGFFALFVDFSSSEASILEIERIDDNTLKVVGSFEKKDAKKMLNAMKKLPELKTIIITSGGGDVDESILIAKEIHKRGINLEVEKYCMSSC